MGPRRDGFDLLLLDMEMPEMDACQVLKQMVANRQLRVALGDAFAAEDLGPVPLKGKAATVDVFAIT